MLLTYHQPSELCRSLVVHYEHVQAEGENILVIDRHIPSGYASLVFNVSGRAAIHEMPLVQLPRLFMVVPLFRAVNIGIYEDLDSFIITCRASMLSRLLSMNFASAKDDYYRSVAHKSLQSISKQFALHTEAQQRIDLIETLLSTIGLHAYQLDEIDLLYHRITDSNGCTPIAEHIERFDKSPRYFRQHFIERTGVNAKTLARIVRVNHLWSMIIKHHAIDFQNMVFEGDYFDQAHLIHDFKNIIGETPSFFFKRNLDNVMLISGKV